MANGGPYHFCGCGGNNSIWSEYFHFDFKSNFEWTGKRQFSQPPLLPKFLFGLEIVTVYKLAGVPLNRRGAAVAKWRAKLSKPTWASTYHVH